MDIRLKDQDLAIVNGDLAMCSTNRDALAQLITVRLKTLKGEWFMDTSLGIPYLSEIFGQKRSLMFIRQSILPHIEAIAGIKKIENFKIKEEANRTILMSFTVILDDGSPIKFNESVGA